MNTTTLRLRAAFADNERSRPLLDGSVAPQGIELDAIALTPGEIFARQLKKAEFDVSDMSLSSLTIATSHGPTPFVAFPVFTVRRFFHTSIIVRADAGINEPADLRGKKVGVPEYQQTANIWNRGVLQHEFGVHPSEMEWFMERTPETSHGGATGFIPPAGIRLTYVPLQDNIGQMLVDGRLDALLFYASHGNEIDRSTIDLTTRREARLLFPDPVAEGRRYFAKTGIYPINHCMVVRRSLAEEHPWVVSSLYDAFCAAQTETARNEMPYGIRANRPVLDAATAYIHEQGLTDRVVGLDEIFAPSVLDR